MIFAKLNRLLRRLLVANDIYATSRPGSIFIGKHTYGIDHNTIIGATQTSSVRIGNYCSIAPDVRILAHVEHPMHMPSTFPFRTLMFKLQTKSDQVLNPDAVTRGPVTIGHDVWIGQNAIILSGVSIGNGAVVGAASVVTKNVDPYAVVAGNPARLVKYRFSPDMIERLQLINWWDLPDESISHLEDYFYNQDINAFIDAVLLEKNKYKVT